ncbi:lysine--tRNA ligase [Candidatus Berkiella cookevillensis]|uniref:Lysine--tRNA ligase n=2 Tax=Candidatus Berkiella cookevillensis TaxID=437022 RepID=A0A0Q9YRT3_9GAMM|nr:lysine--tRNA ligase [Candidatus Berkiella cookevillensis]
MTESNQAKDHSNQDANEPQISLNEQMIERRNKLKALREQGNAYPNDFKRDAYAKDLIDAFGSLEHDVLEQENKQVHLAGRMMTKRLMGKASFIHLQDMTGQIQVYLKQSDLPENVYDAFKHWDLGDIVGVVGTVFKTKTGELSIKASQAHLLSKSLRPLPDKYHGLVDIESCYRQRYLDLMTNAQTQQRFRMRTQLIQGIRNFLNEHRFIEVETPMMHSIAGGAAAKPFKTHHNALDMTLFLRIAPELFLKRLVVGGFERVYEINRNFRNEGLSTRHNPEFTMIEFYQAYADYHDMMNFTEQMIRYLAETVLGKSELHYQNNIFDLTKPFERLTVKEAILKYNPDFKREHIDNYAELWNYAEKLGAHLEKDYGIGKVQIEIFEKTVETKLIAPTFITAYPTEVSPLARKNDLDPTICDRFEFFVGGREIANGFSELNDPEDQAERFREQVKRLEAGDEEAMHYDEDYVTALEFGLPPTAGEGIGIDRLVMLFTDTDSIRDVILFPQMRPQA